MKKTCLVLFILAAFLIPTLAFASTPSPWTEKTTWKDKAVGKLDFGIKNAFGGWTEAFRKPYHAYKDKTNIFEGIGRGLWNGVADEIGGLLHVATFPVTNLDVPLPDNGVQF